MRANWLCLPARSLPRTMSNCCSKWVDSGASWPEAATSRVRRKLRNGGPFRLLSRPAVPAIPDARARTPDRCLHPFEVTALQSYRWLPEADRRTFIRRALLRPARSAAHGRDRSEAFVHDKSADAYEKLIDELLASPRYGEKWGRHWLDLVRYGDTSGFEQDPYLLYAWRYRDYVIDSFNQDKPYDRFVKEQIAGDELYPDDPVAQSGTGYYTVGPNRDMLYKVEDMNRIETLTDYVDTTGSVFLGLDGRLRALPRSQVRSDSAARLLPHAGDLRACREDAGLPAVRSRARLRSGREPAARQIARDRRSTRSDPAAVSEEACPMRSLRKLPAEVRDAFATEEGKRTPAQRAIVEENRKKIHPQPRRCAPSSLRSTRPRCTRSKCSS